MEVSPIASASFDGVKLKSPDNLPVSDSFEAPPQRIDLHSHLLPGIDDGCPTWADSVKCVRKLMERGFVGTVCTPHIIADQFPKNIPENIAFWVADLQEKLSSEGLDYKLWPGGEVRIAPGILQWFDKVGIPTLGPSNYVLTDWWERAWPDYGYQLFEDLIEAGYQPILAHPERMYLDERDLFKLIDRLKELGVWLQGNFNSLGGGEGPQAAEWARHWLANGSYDLVATDMHRPEMLVGRFRGLDEAHRILGDRNLRELLEVKPRAIMESVQTGTRTEDQASAA